MTERDEQNDPGVHAGEAVEAERIVDQDPPVGPEPAVGEGWTDGEGTSESDGEADPVDDAVIVLADTGSDVDRPEVSRTRRPAASARRTVPALNFDMPRIDVRDWFMTARDGVRSLMARPLTSFHLIVGLSVILTICGLIMVQSASSVEDYANKQSAYGAFTTQAVFAVVGWVAFYFIIKLPVRFFRRIATPFMSACLVLLTLVLVPHLGVEVDGARRWFDIGGISIQPSEIAKVALCIWGAHTLAARRSVNGWGRELLLPLLPVVGLMCVLIIAEPNLSTTVIVAIIAAALLWFSGLPTKIFGAFVAALAALGVIAAFSADYRAARVFSFLGTANDPLDGGYQALQARYALVNGGVFGVGLGQSTAKWSYLPNAHNDFIFAILVEETGLVGGLVVVGLFLLLGYVGMRIALRSADPFLRLLTGTITVLITTQMFINIGYVVGLLPVTGIQLPLLSQGGTSMLTMLTMLGLMASAARHEPAAVVALSSRRNRGLSGLLRLPAPVAYRPVADPIDRLGRRRAAGRLPDPRHNDVRRPDPRRSVRGTGERRPAGHGRDRPGQDRPGQDRHGQDRHGQDRHGRNRHGRNRSDTVQQRPARPRSSAAIPDPRGPRRAQFSDEIHYPARQASNRIGSDPRRSAGRSRATGSSRRTEYRQR